MYDWSVYDVDDEALVIWSDQVERRPSERTP